MIALKRRLGGRYYIGSIHNDDAAETFYLTMRTRDEIMRGQRDLVIGRGPLFNVIVMSKAEALESGLYDDPSLKIEEVTV